MTKYVVPSESSAPIHEKITKKDFIVLSNYVYRNKPEAGKILIQEIASCLPDSQIFYSVRDFTRFLLGRSELDLLAVRAQAIDRQRTAGT